MLWEDLAYASPKMDIFMGASLELLNVVHSELTELRDPNVSNSNGWTPLMIACKARSLKIVQYLIANGADVNAVSSRGKTALSLAITNEDLDIVKQEKVLRIQDDYGNDALDCALQNDKPSILEYILERSANKDLSQKKNILKPHAIRGNIEIVHLLLKHGANLKDTDTDGKTARDYALAYGHENIVCLFDCYKLKTVKGILEYAGLQKYWIYFEKRNIDYDKFLKMSEKDMQEIGIKALGARRKLSIIISDINSTKQVK